MLALRVYSAGALKNLQSMFPLDQSEREAR